MDERKEEGGEWKGENGGWKGYWTAEIRDREMNKEEGL